MGDTAGELSVEISGKDVSLTALLNRIEAQLIKAEATSKRAGQSIGEGISSGSAQAESATMRYATSLAGVQRAQGDLAGAVSTYRMALSSLTPNTLEANRATIALAQAEKQLADSTKSTGGFLDAFKQGLAGFVAPAAAATMAIGALRDIGQSFVDAFKFKTELDATTAAFNSQVKSVRDVGQVWSEANAFAAKYRLTQAETADVLKNSTEILRASKSSVSDLELALLRLQQKDPSKPISEAARAMRELQAGDVTTIKEVFNISAADANRMKNEIAGGADAVQVLSKYLDSASVGMDILAQRTTGAKGAMNDLAMAQEQLKLAQAQWAEGPGLTILQAQITGTTGATRILSGDLQAMGQAAVVAAQGNTFAFNMLNAMTNGALNNYVRLKVAQDNAAASTAAHTSANTALVSTIISATQAHTAQAIATAQAAQEQANHTTKLSEAIGKQQDSRIASLQQAQAQQQLASLTGAVVAGEMSKAAAAASLAAQWGVGINVAQQYIAAQMQIAALGGQSAGMASAPSYVRAAYSSRAPRDLSAEVEAEKRYRESRMSPKEEEAYWRDRANTVRQGSAAYWEALQKADSARDKLTKKGGGGGGGAGGVKLTDQQKMNNSLLADQEKYQDNADDLESKHAQQRLKILEDYYTRVRAAQREFEQNQLDGRASFYDNLGNIESASIRQSASAAYEAAAQEAGRIAQEKGADVADKYMSAQEKVISDRARRQAEIEKAQKDKDAGKAEYLRGVDAQYRAAEEARLARIKEGEGSLAAERDKALADEDRQYAEQGDKLAVSAERSADRRILAAQRAGKAVDEETAKTDKLATTYDRIAPGTTGGASTSPVPTGKATGASAPADGTATTDPTVAITAALGAVKAAVEQVERAVRESGTGVAGAVSSAGKGVEDATARAASRIAGAVSSGGIR